MAGPLVAAVVRAARDTVGPGHGAKAHTRPGRGHAWPGTTMPEVTAALTVTVRSFTVLW
ncbi:hypothetical protein [Streptomyces sp. NRRL WC-3618]|uniref:hypothetical protein n=1 Tax=Streptomyces sp. NRRL WC-3618 TaxID=1519490 RepID=UPI000AE7ED02|nr:hypothetical protein [Streptomyces sp. NRRL WC-3618]